MDIIAAQESFGGGIFRGRRAPADCVFDAINGLVNDEREMFRRGGSAFKSSAAGEALLGLWEGYLQAGRRTVMWDDDSFQVLAVDDTTPTVINPTSFPAPFARGAVLGGVVAFPGKSGSSAFVLLHAGSRKTAAYTGGTVSSSAGSTTVSGVGTSWLANVDPGMIASLWGIAVESVTSDTSLKLAQPAPTTEAGISGGALGLSPVVTVRPGAIPAATPPEEIFVAAAGTVPRLLVCWGRKVFATAPGSLTDFLSDSAVTHELPTGSVITGAIGIGDTAVIFTSDSVWAIEGLNFDPLDDVGNIQHRVEKISEDVILWGDSGIAAHGGAIMVPAIDDVYAMSLDGPPVAISDGIRPLYRSYVEAGYKPGTAAVFRGHYFLPVVDGSNALVDVLVCRLDLRDATGGRRPAWTRWSGHAAGRSYAVRVGSSVRDPKLFGINDTRVTDLTGCFDPDATRRQDADATVHNLSVVTNDFDTGPGEIKHYVDNARVVYELVDAASDNPTTALSYAVGPESAAFTSAGAAARGGVVADGTDYSVWRLRKDAARIRLKFETSGPAASAVLRRMALEGELAGW